MSKKAQEGNFTVEVYEGEFVVKVQNAAVTVLGYHKPPGHFQRQKTFSSNTGVSDFVKFENIPLDDYKITVQKDGYESSFTIKKASIYSWQKRISISRQSCAEKQGTITGGKMAGKANRISENAGQKLDRGNCSGARQNELAGS